jgi:hypothetical protein
MGYGKTHQFPTKVTVQLGDDLVKIKALVLNFKLIQLSTVFAGCITLFMTCHFAEECQLCPYQSYHYQVRDNSGDHTVLNRDTFSLKFGSSAHSALQTNIS